MYFFFTYLLKRPKLLFAVWIALWQTLQSSMQSAVSRSPFSYRCSYVLWCVVSVIFVPSMSFSPRPQHWQTLSRFRTASRIFLKSFDLIYDWYFLYSSLRSFFFGRFGFVASLFLISFTLTN